MNDCLKTLLGRRTIYRFKSDPVPDEILYQALEAAVWAPNHGLTEPWRFHVIGPETQRKLADIYARLRADKRCDPDTDAWHRQFEQAQARFLSFPRIVLVGQTISDDPLRHEEDAAAVACAIQNLQLALWSRGVGCQWSTGPVICSERTRRLLDLSDREALVAALYIGWPACVPESKRTPWREVTTFLK